MRPDETTSPSHIGAALDHALQTWRAEFQARMLALGHEVVTEAAAQALLHIPADGATQSAIGRALGVSKQAAQQFVNRLVRLNLVQRRPDPSDHRANRVILTEQGRAFADAAAEVTARIEARYRADMGNSAFAFLKATLTRLPRGDEMDDAAE